MRPRYRGQMCRSDESQAPCLSSGRKWADLERAGTDPIAYGRSGAEGGRLGGQVAPVLVGRGGSDSRACSAGTRPHGEPVGHTGVLSLFKHRGRLSGGGQQADSMLLWRERQDPGHRSSRGSSGHNTDLLSDRPRSDGKGPRAKRGCRQDSSPEEARQLLPGLSSSSGAPVLGKSRVHKGGLRSTAPRAPEQESPGPFWFVLQRSSEVALREAACCLRGPDRRRWGDTVFPCPPQHRPYGVGPEDVSVHCDGLRSPFLNRFFLTSL